jgi:dienelactone hydrolase
VPWGDEERMREPSGPQAPTAGVRRMRRALPAVAACLALAAPVATQAFTPRPWSPATEAGNYAKVEERQTIYDTPGYQLMLRAIGVRNTADALAQEARDPEREFLDHVCAFDADGCAGDVRLDGWQTGGHGLVEPVHFTARDGATLSGHVWATRSGPARRPGIVITAGSLQADEQMYWYVAQALAKAGYLVLTFDPQGQGQSDTLGEGLDRMEGVPAQRDGRPFFDGTEDAVDFLVSTPARPYLPVPSCSTGTSHAAKQRSRVLRGLDSGYDPFWTLLDPGRIGLAGHSFGAAGVSYVGQWDPRVTAIVAWDNLGLPVPVGQGSFPPGEAGCPANPAARRPVPVTRPALGMSADYFLPALPNTAQPDATGCTPPSNPVTAVVVPFGCKSTVSREYSRAGVDTGELVIRGGTHTDFSFIPDPAFGATLRGADMVAWYTTAWFDRYLRGDPTADARLLTSRWQRDAAEAAIDPAHDGNMFSFYYASRLDIHVGRRVVDCEDLRAGCPGLVSEDGAPPEYSYVAVDTSPDPPPR